MSVIHYTTKERLSEILKSGLKINADKNLTISGGDYSSYIYQIYTGVERPIYFCINDENIFRKESDVAIEVNLKTSDLVADLQSLVDHGAIFTDDGEYIYFKRMPDVFRQYGFNGELMVCDLLEVGNPAAEAAIELTGTGVYLHSLSTKAINTIREYSGYGLLGNCVNSFDDDGDCIIDIFSDVSDFACVEEDSVKIDKETFLSKIHMKLDEFDNSFGQFKNVEFLENKDRGIYMLYDIDSDVHYFFREVKEVFSYGIKKKFNSLKNGKAAYGVYSK